jgi:DNA polymerase (family 10)
MTPLPAPAVAKLLVEIGQRLTLAGENPYKARSYLRAADGLMSLAVPLDEAIAQGRLREIPGVGAALAETIFQLHLQGTTPKLARMREEVPAGVLELLRVPGLRPQNVTDLHRKLGIASLEALQEACAQGQVGTCKGLGPALEAKIRSGIELMRRSEGQRLLHHAEEILHAAAASLRRARPELSRVVPAGDYRRGCELISSFALVAEGPGTGIRKERLGDTIDLWIADPKRYGVALLLATGSQEHLIQLQRAAGIQGYRLDEKGLHRGRALVRCPDEEAVFAALGLPFIAPELREGLGEVEAAGAQSLPRLVAEDDLRGALHCHTDFSDGGNTLAEMAEATRKRGLQYFGVADHSKSAGYAGGLSVEKVAEQHRLADALNAGYGPNFRIFKGIESDILEDGSLDYPDEILASFDFVVASVHSRFRLDPDTQTKRILTAVANPYTTILGHMTGRLLLRREGYELDIEQVLEACARHGVAVEINANPHRLDLDWRWVRRALEIGCTIAINPDAHSIAELDLTRFGVLMARKAGVPPERVLNTQSVAEIARLFAGRKGAPAGTPPGRRTRRA